MYTLLTGLYKQYNTKKDYYACVLGLDNAGKTTFLECVKQIYTGASRSKNTLPTVGLNSIFFEFISFYIWNK